MMRSIPGPSRLYGMSCRWYDMVFAGTFQASWGDMFDVIEPACGDRSVARGSSMRREKMPGSKVSALTEDCPEINVGRSDHTLWNASYRWTTIRLMSWPERRRSSSLSL